MRPRWLRGGDGDGGAAAPAVGYLWNPADPRSYEARRRSGWETPGSPAAEPSAVWGAARHDEDTRLPILPAAKSAEVGRIGSLRRPRWPAAVVVGAAAAIGVAAAFGAFSSDGPPPAISRSATSPPAIAEERSTVDDVGQANIPAESPLIGARTVELSPRESYLQALRTSQDRVHGAIPVFDGQRASPDFVTASVSRVGVFALLLDSVGSALNRSLSDLRRLEPPVEFRTDHAVLIEFYAGALELNRGARGRARGPDFGGADFRIVMLEIRRLELGHVVRLSRDACLVLIDDALCALPGTAPTGEYGASLNLAVRELAALRSATSPELPFPQSEADDLTVARTRIDWQLSDLAVARARAAALRPPAEFASEHAALLEVLAGAASHLVVQRERLGHTQIGARLVVPMTICLQESRFASGFRRLAPIALLPQELLCPPPFTFVRPNRADSTRRRRR